MKSYIHAKGSYSEAISSQYISEILSIIPDNSNNQVSPKDLRNALFSVWEGSPIKFTHVSSFSYIGLNRPETKLKIFLGKKEVMGQSVMSIDLLNSDVDIFLYNNKSDDEHQNFKMSILAGLDRSLWKFAPYVEVKERDGKLDMGIVNPNGDINLHGDTISVNGVNWPSIENLKDMILNPSKIEDGDLGLILVDGKFIQAKKMNEVNDLLFSDDNPTQIDIGGVKSGSTFKDVPILEILRQILYPYLPPKVDIIIMGVSNNCIERDHVNGVSLELKVSILRRSENIKSRSLKISNTKTIFLSKDDGGFESNGPSNFEYLDFVFVDPSRISVDKFDGLFKLSMDVEDINGGIGNIVSNINFVYPYFYGFGDQFKITSDSASSFLGSLNKRIDMKINQSIPVIGSGYFYFAYPKIYGKLNQFNSMDILKVFEIIEVKNVYSIDGKWGSVDYIVYTSKEKISISGIPQIWKFDF